MSFRNVRTFSGIAAVFIILFSMTACDATLNKVYVATINVTAEGGATTITTPGGTLQMSAEVLPADATNPAVAWSVTKGTGNATISSTGLLKAVANGTVSAVATAADGSGVKGSLEVTLTNQSASELSDTAIAALKTGDYDEALSEFSIAILADPTNASAVVGYSLLNLASIVTDSNLSSALANNLGIVGYPTTMNDAVNPTNWLIHTATATHPDEVSGEPVVDSSMLFPTISGETDIDENGIIDLWDRMYALATFVFTHNTGFDFIPQLLDNALGSRLDTAIQVIKNGATDSTQFAVTWDMVYDTEPTTSNGEDWPLDSDGNPMAVVIGKAELLAMAASLESLRFVLNLAQVYTLTLPLSEYWSYYVEGSSTRPSTLPFATLLQPSATATASLAAAKASLTSAATDMITALTSVASDRAGFFLSSDTTAGMLVSSLYDGMETVPTFAGDIVPNLNFAKTVMQYMKTSVTDNVVYYFPTGSFNPATDTWPTSIVLGSSAGVNLGILLSSPIALVSTSGLMKLAPSGEPQFYQYTEGTGTFVALSSSTDSFFPTSPPDFTDDPTVAYVRMTDATAGGAVALTNYPYDPATAASAGTDFYGFSGITEIDFTDLNSDGIWQNGETINSAVLFRSTNGLIKLSALSAYSSMQDYLKREFTTAVDAIYSLSASNVDMGQVNYLDDLKTAIATLTPSTQVRVADSFRPVLQDQSAAGDYKSVYLPVPRYTAWLSLSASGALATDPSGTGITSPGSVYWYFLDGTLSSVGF